MATSNRQMVRFSLAFVGAFALAQPAWALFGTGELTRQVQVLQQQVNTIDARLGKLELAMQDNQQLLDLLKEVEALKAELAKLRGQSEVQMHQLDTLGKRQSDLYADLDQRIADMSKVIRPVPEATAQPVADGQPVSAGDSPKPDSPLETRSYEAALKQFREANYATAIVGFNDFLKTYSDSTLAANAQYWIGYSYYVLKDYKTALTNQQKLLANYPASNKVPDALFNIAANQLALDNPGGARKTLEEIVAKYPDSQAASLAARRLSELR